MNALTARRRRRVERGAQNKAEILNTPIWTLKNRQSGTVGMAMLCSVAMGRFASFEQAAEALVKRDTLIEPTGKYRALYEDKYGRYLEMYAASRRIFGRD